jgi:hypothetical protein
MAWLTRVSRCSGVELELAAQEHTLTLVKTSSKEALDSKGCGTVFVERMRCVTDAIGPRAQDTLQAEAAVVDSLTEEIRHERGFARHREREKSARKQMRRHSTRRPSNGLAPHQLSSEPGTTTLTGEKREERRTKKSARNKHGTEEKSGGEQSTTDKGARWWQFIRIAHSSI